MGAALTMPSGSALHTPVKGGSTLGSLACLTEYGSGSSLDVKTPRLSHISPFDSLTNIKLNVPFSAGEGVLVV